MSEYPARLPSNNAYDFYITAARQLKGGEAYAGQQPPTPQERRWVETNQGAFNTLRHAMGKAYRWPFGVVRYDFYSDEFAKLRQLARLVNTRIRVAIATRDGVDAVHDWRVGFQMARDLQGGSTRNYLVGVAVESVIHAPIVREIDFFSAHECREMAQTLTRSERTPDRFPSVIEGELDATLQMLDAWLPETLSEEHLAWEGLRTLLLEGGEEAPDAQTQQLRKHLENELNRVLRQPNAYRQLRAQLRREIARSWQTIADAIALQGGRYREPKLKAYPEDTLLGALLDYMLPSADVVRVYWESRTRRRLMLIRM
ncbi:MAG: hypothetical protein ACUVV1_02815, partial [Fimbriimonadales bacterium]